MVHPALGYLVTLLGARLDKARREEGASAVEWVVIAAVLVGICTAVGLILTNALRDEATSIGNDIKSP
jgi:Flp pilus assembly pilin Flp